MKILSGNKIKLIACISMFIDHLAIVYLLLSMVVAFNADTFDGMRIIGRIAFPLYCFLLVEGFVHTKNRMKYLISILITAFISQIPFSLLFNPKFFEISGVSVPTLNVCFTLGIGLITLMCIEKVKKPEDNENYLSHMLYYGLNLLIIILSCTVTYILDTDYSYTGIILIVILYYLRKTDIICLITGFVVFSALIDNIWVLPSFVIMYMYNGKRGKNIGKFKYLFYAFYPLHMAFLYLLLRLGLRYG